MWVWLDKLILIVLAILVLIIFVGSLYAFFYAIFLFVFSAGDPDKIKTAWNSIRYMLMGIILTIFLLFIFPVIFKRVWVENAEQFEASSIFNMATQIVNYLFTFGKESIELYQAGEVGNFPGSNAWNTGSGIPSSWNPSLSPTILPPSWEFEL